MVGVTKIQRGNAGYWIEAVAEGGDDYYSKPGEAPGEWLGDLATDVGLVGKVDRDGYTAILGGAHPGTGDQLLARPQPRRYIDSACRQRTAEPVLGYDVRFAAPKSVSLLYAIGSPKVRAAVLHAHNDAVAQGMAYLQENACLVQRGRNGVTVERGAGLVGMAFRHRMSRAGDPALHTHVVVSNITRAISDGRWLTLASPKGRSPFYLHAKPAGFVYQAALRHAIGSELGLTWGTVKNGYADLAAFGREVIEHFSQRRMEIVEDMARRGTSSARAAEVSAYRTRDAKDYGVDEDVRREEWAARAGEFGLSAGSIEQLVDRAVRRVPSSPRSGQALAALRSLEATRSHFDRRDLVCALANQLPNGADAAALSTAVDSVLEGDEVIRLNQPANAIEPVYYTTPKLAAAEERVIEVATSGADAGVGVVPNGVLAEVLEHHEYLGEDQRKMLRRLLTGGERVVPVAALPGTGKTTTLDAAREGWQRAGFEVRGVATARSASTELEDAGVPATSLTALLMEMERWRSRGLPPLRAGTIVLMDESTTTETLNMADLASAIEECGGKLVPIGDTKQIGAVGPGGTYGRLTRQIDTTILSTIRRQRSDAARRVVELAHAGRGSDALDVMRSEDQLVVADQLPDALDALVLDWSEDFRQGEDAVMIARRNRDVDTLNQLARASLREAGVLPEADQLTVGGEGFAVGDHVLTRINVRNVSNRERWQITAIDREQRTVELSRLGRSGKVETLDSDYLAETTPAGEPAIEHAYALTIYASQGKTFDSTFCYLDPGSSQEEFVVAVSRARGSTTGYAVAAAELTDPDLGPGRRELEDELHELRRSSERSGADIASVEVEARERLARLDLPELFARRSYLERQLTPSSSTVSGERLSEVEERIEEVASRLASDDAELRREAATRKPNQALLQETPRRHRGRARDLRRADH